MTVAEAALNEQVEFLASLLMDRSHRQQQSYELGGPFEFPGPYQQALNEIDSAIGRLKSLRREMQSIAKHVHEWNDDDYCRICGADGRA